MNRASFRFYAELNDFLPEERRQRPFQVSFRGKVTVKHLVESFGVPHSEIDLILIDGESVDFTRVVEDGDSVSVYPVFESIDISPVGRLRPNPLRESRFVLDIHLGQLATYLRLLGFDTLYQNDFDDSELAKISSEERRILLTKDRGVLKRNLVTHGYCVREIDPQLQLQEVIRRFDLQRSIAPFQRCLKCNGKLEPVEKEKILDRLEHNTSLYYDDFRICLQCDQIYWKGSHYSRMLQFLEEVLESDVQ